MPPRGEHRGRARPADEGAAAVEFALVLPLLLVVLFGILSLGWNLWERQAASATAREVARSVALGLGGTPATTLRRDVACLAHGNGLPAAAVDALRIDYLAADLAPTSGPLVEGYVQVTLTTHSTLDGALPFSVAGGPATSRAIAHLEQPTPALAGGTVLDLAGATCT